ncbi:MAG: homocysteine biosynthesis protein [Bacillota bacterium]
MPKTLDEINEKIKSGQAVVVTAEEIIPMVKEQGPARVARDVDVVTTGTFGPMCSSGAFLNFGHSDPPIKMSRVWLNRVPAYAGVAAVDAYIGATEPSEDKGLEYGGAHVIEDLVAGKEVELKAQAYGTDCYPRREITTRVSLDTLNQAYLFNPRNAYQNYAVAANTSGRTLHTYMGTLLPRLGNITYCSAGQLSPLLNDPQLRTIGIGTRVFLGGAPGYVAWEGTQHNPGQARGENLVPLGPAGTLALIGDLKAMNTRFLRACTFQNYGPSLYVGVGIPIPILDEDLAWSCSVTDDDIYSNVIDYACPGRSRPVLGRLSYAQLRSGLVQVGGKQVRTAPLSSYARAREIASVLKAWILERRFTLQAPVQSLPVNPGVKPLREVQA